MKRFLLPFLLIATTSAAADVIRLDCPTARADFAFWNHKWSLDLGNRKAILTSDVGPGIKPGTYSIFKVTDDHIFIMKDEAKKEYWTVDRYTLSSSINYAVSGRTYILSEKCHVSQKQF